MNVISARGGKAHLGNPDSPVPFPLCGAASRNTVTRFRHTPQDVDCKECSGILERRAERLAREAQGEDQDMMAGRNDVNTPEGEQIIEQIDANIERATSLAEAENTDGLKELSEETETLISSLAGKGSAAVKKAKRDAWSAAATAQPKPPAKAPQAKEGVVVEKTWDQYEGVQELVTMAAERMAEGIRQHQKLGEIAGEIAAVTFDVWLRLPNKQELPDLRGASNKAKSASGEMLRLAGEGFPRTKKNEDSLKSLERKIQYQRTDVRAKWLRSLDEDTEEAAERRALFGSALDNKPEGTPYSQYVAVTLYNSPAMLKGEGEKSLERWQRKQELAAGGAPELPAEPEKVDEATATEWLLADTEKLKRDVSKARTAYYNAASAEAREQAKDVLTEVLDSVRRMLAETL